MRRLAVLLVLVGAAVAAQALTYPAKPSRKNFYSDEAGLITEAAGKRINDLCWPLWKKEKIPLYVVTIDSLAAHDAAGQAIEGYAYDLFNSWGIGSQRRNYGMLLLISKGDRRARIELGSGWGHKHDYQAQRIMNTLIIPEFKKGGFAAGIVAGVEGMDALARGLELPKPKQPWWAPFALIGGVLLVVGIAYSLFKSGRSGWGWAFLAGVAILLWFMLRAAASSSAGMGGGSSGGGGASGSW